MINDEQTNQNYLILFQLKFTYNNENQNKMQQIKL